MAARPRSRQRRDWPAGLQESRPGYFVWFNPVTKSYVAIGRVTVAEARAQAIEANLWATQQTGKARLIDRLMERDKTVAEWLTEWIAELEVSKKYAVNTLRSYRSQIKALSEQIGAHVLSRLSVMDCDKAIVAIEAERGARTAQVCRSILVSAFKRAMTKGLMESNPAEALQAVDVEVQRQRFTWDSFSKVWAALGAAPVWLRHAVALGLLTGQRREDIAELQFSDVVDGVLRVVPIKNKGKVKLAIPVDLRMDRLGISLREQIAQCRRTGVASRYMVHQTEPHGNSPVGQKIWRDTITRRFSEYVEAALGPGKNLPTFHELRSLSKRVYMEQGGVDTKALLGHTTEQTADLYGNARGAEFKLVKVG